MPQMAPMSWVTTFIYFTLLLIMIIINNYFYFLYKPKVSKINNIKSNINWKW
uniref:ATP synthase complex subunit 8 n=1 Tax=Mecysmoderes ater TaxID=3158840 RepID=A0AAU7GHB2_9CUCU